MSCYQNYFGNKILGGAIPRYSLVVLAPSSLWATATIGARIFSFKKSTNKASIFF
jgi:hypothetical protein